LPGSGDPFGFPPSKFTGSPINVAYSQYANKNAIRIAPVAKNDSNIFLNEPEFLLIFLIVFVVK
jgi:hypothetical protein